MPAEHLGPYQVTAHNTSHASENKIHDDAIARSFGFGGGLVPGVEVYGYMTHLPVVRWGRAWLERGIAECRFYKPVYDGDTVSVTAAEAGDGGLDITVESRSEVCAGGRAAMPDDHVVPPSLADFPSVPQRRDRPPANETTLAVGTVLGLDPYWITAELVARRLADSGESVPIYAAEALAVPVEALRACNDVISRNVLLGPWVHTGSRIQHFGAVSVGSALSVRARVTDNFEKRGHRFVEIDALVIADNSRPVARVTHTAIYRLRAAAAAA